MCCFECDEAYDRCCGFSWGWEIVTSLKECLDSVGRGFSYCGEQLCCCACEGVSLREACCNPLLCVGNSTEACLRGTTDGIKCAFEATERCSKIPSILFGLASLASMAYGVWWLITMDSPGREQALRGARDGVAAFRVVVSTIG